MSTTTVTETKPKTTDRQACRLLEDLRAFTGVKLERPGAHYAGTIPAGDLEITITVRVKRHAPPDTIDRYRKEALETLAQKPTLVRQCNSYITRRGSFGGGGSRCRNPVSATIAYKPITTETVAFLFVCSSHREHHHLHPETVLATVELATSSLAEAKRKDAAAQEEWSRKCREEDEYYTRRSTLEKNTARANKTGAL